MSETEVFYYLERKIKGYERLGYEGYVVPVDDGFRIELVYKGIKNVSEYSWVELPSGKNACVERLRYILNEMASGIKDFIDHNTY